MRVSCYGKCAEGPSVEGMVHGNDFMIRFSVLKKSIFAGRLQSAFHCLRAAVGKKDTIHAGDLFQLHRRFHCRNIIIIIGSVDHLVYLAFQSIVVFPVIITQREYGDSGTKIQIFFPFDVCKVNAVAFIQNHLVAVIGM